MHDRLGDHGVNALRAVDRLRYSEIAGEAAKHVSVLARQVGLLAEQDDHVAQCHHGALVEIRVHAHGDVMGRRLGARIGEFQIVAHGEA